MRQHPGAARHARGVPVRDAHAASLPRLAAERASQMPAQQRMCTAFVDVVRRVPAGGDRP